MKLNRCKHLSAVAAIVLLLVSAQAQSPLSNQASRTNTSEFRFDIFKFALAAKARPTSFSLMPAANAKFNAAISDLPAGPNLQVLGSGTADRISKWRGLTSSNSFLGDSGIFESKLGDVGIGTDNPVLAKLTVIDSRFGVESFWAIRAIRTGEGGAGIRGEGGAGSTRVSAGSGVQGRGGEHSTGTGGIGVSGFGGGGLFGGLGVLAVGGLGESDGGDGLDARGGVAMTDCCGARGGRGIVVSGGRGFDGGSGVRAVGGDAIGGKGGDGVIAFGGRTVSDTGSFGVFGGGGISENSDGGTGVRGQGGTSTNGFGGIGLYGRPGFGPKGVGLAGKFEGDVEITGTLTKGGGMFKIDHPLDPTNKYLSHSFVESPDMKNVYDGVALLDRKGEAVVKLPDYFQALNRDFRYQLTALGVPGPRLYIAKEISANQFKIAGGRPGMKVSWQVTGSRHDPWAETRPIVVEEEKAERERGSYLHPEAYRVSEEKRPRKRAILR